MPISRDGDLEWISHKGPPFKRGLLCLNHLSPHFSPILYSLLFLVVGEGATGIKTTDADVSSPFESTNSAS